MSSTAKSTLRFVFYDDPSPNTSLLDFSFFLLLFPLSLSLSLSLSLNPLIRSSVQELLYYESSDAAHLRRPIGQIPLKEVYSARKTGRPNEFELSTGERVYTLLAESDADLLRCVTVLAPHCGGTDSEQRLDSSSSSTPTSSTGFKEEEEWKKGLFKGSVMLDEEFSPSLCSVVSVQASMYPSLPFPLPLMPRERVHLSDVEGSVQKMVVTPRILLLSVNDDQSLSLTVEILGEEGRPLPIKSGYFDRMIGDASLLFYIELQDVPTPVTTSSPFSLPTDTFGSTAAATSSSPAASRLPRRSTSIWMLVRSVMRRRDGSFGTSEVDKTSSAHGALLSTHIPLLTVHDLNCPKCRLSRRDCDLDRGLVIGTAKVKLNIFFLRAPGDGKDASHFHVMLLSHPDVGCLSLGFLMMDTRERVMRKEDDVAVGGTIESTVTTSLENVSALINKLSLSLSFSLSLYFNFSFNPKNDFFSIRRNLLFPLI